MEYIRVNNSYARRACHYAKNKPSFKEGLKRIEKSIVSGEFNSWISVRNDCLVLVSNLLRDCWYAPEEEIFSWGTQLSMAKNLMHGFQTRLGKERLPE